MTKEISHLTRRTTQALERLEEFISTRKRMSGTDPEVITVSNDAPLLMSDMQEVIVFIRQSLAAGGDPKSAQVDEWMPIESRPKSGTYLVTDGVYVAPWINGVIHNNSGTPWDWQYGEAITGWQPLPPPPALQPEPRGTQQNSVP